MSTSTSVETNLALPAAQAVFDAINSKDISCIPDCVTADFVDHGSPFPLPPGPDGYTKILTFVTRVLDIRYELMDLFCTSDRIVARAIAHGTAVAPVHGAEFEGRTYAMETIHIYRTEGDRLAEHWGVRDELGVLIQIGARPAPESPF
jgi:predicted ester cyclase